MAVLGYQAAIAFTLLLVRLISPKHLLGAALVWTGLTLINLFWPPLILVQLFVIWVTYSALTPSKPSQEPLRTEGVRIVRRKQIIDLAPTLKDAKIAPSGPQAAEIIQFAAQPRPTPAQASAQEFRQQATAPKSGLTRCNIDLCLFELDDTLLRTGALWPWRDRDPAPELSELRAKLSEQVSESRYIITPELLNSLRRRFPAMKLGVVTNAPSGYAHLLLAWFYPAVRWDVTIAHADRPKPFPDGIQQAMKKAAIPDARNVALVGSNKTDVLAAYFSGCWSVINVSSNKSHPNQREWTLQRMPDALIGSPAELADALANLTMMLPDLERRVAGRAPSTTEGLTREGGHRAARIETFRHTAPRGDAPPVQVAVLGRYFATHDALLPRSSRHTLTKQILGHKNAVQFPHEWIESIRDYLLGLKLKPGSLVTCIPRKPDGIPRMESLLRQIQASIGSSSELSKMEFYPDAMAFRSGVLSSHRMRLTAKERFANVERSLYVARPERIRNRQVVVIDDVITSGATMVTASNLLGRAGAIDVKCVAIAKAISDKPTAKRKRRDDRGIHEATEKNIKPAPPLIVQVPLPSFKPSKFPPIVLGFHQSKEEWIAALSKRMEEYRLADEEEQRDKNDKSDKQEP